MPNDNNLPPLPVIPVPEVDLQESGQFTFFSNLENLANIPRNWVVSYNRLQDSNPNTPTYQLVISSGVGTAAETVFRGVATYRAGVASVSDLFKITRDLVAGNKAPAVTEIYGGAIEDISGNNVYKYINQIGDGANNLFSDVTQNALGGIFGGSFANPNSSQNPNSSKTQDSVAIIESTNSSGQNTSITATKSTNPSGKSSVSVSSKDYTKDQLTESSKSLIQNEGSNLVGSNIKIEGSDGTINANLLNDSLKSEAEKFFDKDTKLDAPILSEKDSSGNSLYLFESDEDLTLSDGSTSNLGTVINAIESAANHLKTFASSSFNYLVKPFQNNANLAYMATNIVAELARGGDLDDVIERIALQEYVAKPITNMGVSYLTSQLNLNLTQGETSTLLAFSNGTIDQLPDDLTTKLLQTEGLNAGIQALVSFAITAIVNGKDMGSEDYLLAAANIGVSQAIGWGVNALAGTTVTNATSQVAAQAAANATITSTAAGATTSSGTTAATTAAAKTSLIKASTPGQAAAGGAAVALTHIAIAGIQDIGADDHMNSHQWQSTVVSGAALGVAYFLGSLTPLGPIGGMIATIVVSQFMGGKEYGPGEYPDPYSFLKIEAKADGTGNKIIGIEPQGVVAIAREYYHDDLYGTQGSDTLVGKSGTNTIMGYGGNDHLEGRGDIDLLVGGAGDDEIFGGNGDDQLYGSEGSDNLFGGNGNDQIVGGEGNDFIQGGNGDDQIMGEAGNDQIQGNSGNDTILGGTGNDRIEGNEGDDSILGEDGDDIIIGDRLEALGVSGVDGNDIIDGGAGADIIEGNGGNDNIRGGDGNDEISGNSGVDIIYGDAGNDLINTGSENDLAFGGLGNDIIYGADGDDTLSGELGNDYVIGADGADTIDGGAGDDVILGGIGNDTITTSEGNDTVIYRTGDGQDTITDTDTAGNDILRLTEINSKLSNNTTDKLFLTKSGTDLIIQFKDDSGSIISSDKITVTNQFGGAETSGTGSEILKKIEFADGKAIANDNFLTEQKFQKTKKIKI